MGLIDVSVGEFTPPPVGAMILGGRWDGHEVEFQGERVEYKGEYYVALHNGDGRTYYLLEPLLRAWFRVGR